MADPFLDIDASSLDKLGADLAASVKGLAKEQRRSNKEVATQVAAWASGAAAGGTRQQAAAAAAIRPRSTQNLARLAVTPTAAVPFANVAFFGMKRRTGWYAKGRYAGSVGRQGPEWVGGSWLAGQAGEGPYVINDTVASHVDDIEDLYAAGYERALRAAFPGGFNK